MSAARSFQNLALVGFMGAGKSTVGRIAAAQLRFDFIDTDDLIEEQAGRSIPEIFQTLGEPRFREYERQAVERLKERGQTVISAGGGLVLNPANLESLKEHALVVCLWATPETLWQRVRHQNHRPLLQAPDPYQRMCDLLAAREPHYRNADVLLNTEGRSLKEVAHQVVHQFHLARKQ